MKDVLAYLSLFLADLPMIISGSLVFWETLVEKHCSRDTRDA